MKPVSEMAYHPLSEKVVDILCTKTQNEERLFFRVVLAYYWAQMASSMRATIHGYDRGDLPINIYALNLSPSGTGKGYSTSLIEREIINQFRENFLEYTFPEVAEQHLLELAHKRATRKSTASQVVDPDDELERVRKEFEGLGSLLFSFDSGTTPAVKQMRHKLLMGNAGGVNLQIDEIGANLVGQTEVLDTFLELYDLGMVKEKLVKSTSENVRSERLIGATPTNMLLFGTPTKLFDGDITERRLNEMLEMGYARRCLFGFVTGSAKKADVTAEEMMKQMFNAAGNDFIEDLSTQLGRLADVANIRKKIILPEAQCLELLRYRLFCEERGREYSEHESVKKSEMDNRFFKTLKLAAAYAFIDESAVITQDHLENAIKLVEESGDAFAKLMTPERPYVKLAKYLSRCKTDVTLADLDQDLPYFRGGKNQKDELITMATAWGYKNNIIIKKAFNDGIQFLRGETLKETNLDEMILAYSKHMTEGYKAVRAPFDKLHQLVQTDGYHWLNHHVRGGYRNEENAEPGFNLIVLDIDGTMNLSTAKLLLQGQKALFYTTKRHTDACNRFRIIMPANYELEMDAKEYKEFMQNVIEGLPFEVDESCTHRCKKWLSHKGHFEYQDGDLFDVLPYIPKTSKNEERKALLDDQQSMDNLERWVINNTGDGNRNNMLLRFATILVDAGFDIADIRSRVISLNDKLPDKLEDSEIDSSIMITVARKLANP